MFRSYLFLTSNLQSSSLSLSLCLYPLRNLITFAHAAHRRKWLSVETLDEVQRESWVRSFVDEEKVGFNFSYFTCSFFIVARSHINLACALTDSWTTRKMNLISLHYCPTQTSFFHLDGYFHCSPARVAHSGLTRCSWRLRFTAKKPHRKVAKSAERRGRFLRSKKLSGKSSTFNGEWQEKKSV